MGEQLVALDCEALRALAEGRMVDALRAEPRCEEARALVAALRGDRAAAVQALRAALAAAHGNEGRARACAVVADACEEHDVSIGAREAATAALASNRRPGCPPPADGQIEIAQAELRARRPKAALARLSRLDGPGSDPDVLFRLLRDLGQHDEAAQLAERTSISPALTARLALDRGDAAYALEIASEADLKDVEAIALVLLGRLDAAARAFAAAEMPDSGDIWRAELLLRQGEFERAAAAAKSIANRNHSVAAMVVWLAAAASHRVPAWRWRRRMNSDPSHELFRAHGLEPLVSADDSHALTQSPDDAKRIAFAVLDSLRGARTGQLTRLVGGSLQSVTPAGATREMAVEIQRRFRTGTDSEKTRAAFEALQKKFPWSPYPWTYFGEFLLWLGDSAGARSAFIRALRCAPNRWAHVGLSLVSVLHGRPGAALVMSRLGVLLHGTLPQSTVTGLEGEAAVRLGLHQRAVPLLRRATTDKPGRNGARAFLALALLRLGKTADAAREWDTVRNAVPALATDLPAEPDPEAIATLTDRMRGNRSSWIITGEVDGTVRVLANAVTVQRAAEEVLRFAGRP